MNVGFIIPVYKNPKQLEKCMEAIDNLETAHDVTVFQHNNSVTNIGFTKAVNKGLVGYMDGMTDYCVVLNQDCYVKPDFLDKAIDFMQKNSNCAIAGVKQLSDKDEDFIIHGGCSMAFPEGRHLVGKQSTGSCDESGKMPWVNGACMIVDMDILPKIGVMDENFFLIGSDSDWCYTARQRGYDVCYIADAVVVHEQGISTKKGSKTLESAKMMDMVYFRDKWINDGVFRELEMEVFD